MFNLVPMLTFAGVTFLGMFVVGLLLVSGVGPVVVLALPQILRSARQGYGRTNVSYSPHRLLQPPSLSILIPVFQDPSGLARTLQSIEQVQRFPERAGFKSIEVCIGIDGDCSECEQVSKSYTVSIVRSHENQGKWSTLKRLVEYSGPSQWVAFVDAGVEWSEELLMNCAQSLHQQDIMGVAPAYQMGVGGRMNRLFWWIEASIKRVENFFGGPVSVHGATVLYSRSELVKALHELGSISWINDDVVIPLAMRTMFPEKKIIYKESIRVHDVDTKAGDDSGSRRLRLVLGNCQWIKWLYPKIWRRNRFIAILALRRIARVIWVWWLVFFLVGISLFALPSGSEGNHYLIPLMLVSFLPVLVLLRRLLPGAPFMKSIGGAVEGSLKSPLYLITLQQKRKILWN